MCVCVWVYGCACVSLCMLALFQCRSALEQVYVQVCISLCAYVCVCVCKCIHNVCVCVHSCACIACVCVFESLPQQLPAEEGGRELVHWTLSQ